MARRPGLLTTSIALGSCSLMSVEWVTTRIWRKRPSQALQGLEHACLAFLVKWAENLVEDQQADGAS